MQCQFGAFLKDSLIFLLGDIKVYNIFRVLFWLSPHCMVWQEGEGGSSSVGGEGGVFGFALLRPFLTMLLLLPTAWAVCISVSAYSRT